MSSGRKARAASTPTMGRKMEESRNASTGHRSWALVGGAGLSHLASPAQSFVITDGDVVAIYIKNGVEMIVNVGSIDDVEAGHPFSTNLTLPTQFGGNLVGAKLIVLGIRGPNAEFQPGFARKNFLYSTKAGSSTSLLGL